jgi:hypothetical protein
MEHATLRSDDHSVVLGARGRALMGRRALGALRKSAALLPPPRALLPPPWALLPPPRAARALSGRRPGVLAALAWPLGLDTAGLCEERQ